MSPVTQPNGAGDLRASGRRDNDGIVRSRGQGLARSSGEASGRQSGGGLQRGQVRYSPAVLERTILQSFASSGLAAEGKFKAAGVRFTSVDQIDTRLLRRWLAESRDIQWAYRNLVRRKGVWERLKQAVALSCVQASRTRERLHLLTELQ